MPGWVAFLAILIVVRGLFAVTVGPAATALAETGRFARILYVDQAKGDDIKGDGSVVHPLRTIARGLELAGRPTDAAAVAIYVSAGRYSEPTFALKPYVTLFGGFETPGGTRDLLRHRTVLDGEGMHRIAIGADLACVDGFVFEGGRVRGKGAALLCDGVSPLISHCVFADNRTLVPAPWNPPLLHETTNDGGAIMCLNGAAPRIEHCLFYDNSTECGRGGAVAADRGAMPQIRHSVFTNNRTGLIDLMRSSDGGAVSFFRGSGGVFENNIVVANESLTRNDAGGVFVALWSAPKIVRNVFVANVGGDDAGALFLGGQEHRYGVPLDAYPPADSFRIVVEGNVFVGNSNSTSNSGAMRVTMETRTRLAHNVIAENEGGFYLQRSEVEAERNTVWQDWNFAEDKASLGPSRFVGNILKGPVRVIEARITFVRNAAPAGIPGGPHLPVTDYFVDDGLGGDLVSLSFDASIGQTVFKTSTEVPSGNWAGRPVRLADNMAKTGQWRVIARASGHEIVVWGRLDAVTKAPKHFAILRSFRLKPEAPKELGADVQP